jgi:hypothetical protein
MANVRCPHCGLLNFADAAGCKRCKNALPEPSPEVAPPQVVSAEVASDDFASADFASADFESAGAARAHAPGVRALRWLVALALAAVVVFVAYSFRDRIRYGQHFEYALAIRDSEQFAAPMTVAAKQRFFMRSPGPSDFTHRNGLDIDPVRVLEERGLVKSESTKEVGVVDYRQTSPGVPSTAWDPGMPPSYRTTYGTYEGTNFSLTREGERAAGGWKDEGTGSWVVPIGSRRLYRVLRVREAKAECGGAEACEVEFNWRWSPEGAGEAFDTDGSIYALMTGYGRAAAEKLGWGSAHNYRAVALLERVSGGPWRVTRVRKSDDFDEKTEVPAF